jgi:hypothetical protein
MKAVVFRLVPANRIVAVHADLGEEIEHEGVQEHIRKFTPQGVPVHIVKNELRSLLDEVLDSVIKDLSPAQ